MGTEIMVGSRYRRRAEVDGRALAYGQAVGSAPRRGVTPFFAVALIAPLWRAVYEDPRLGRTAQEVLHAEQHLSARRALEPGEHVDVCAEVVDVVSYGFGDGLVIHGRVSGASGDEIISMESVLAVQGSTVNRPDSRRPQPPPARGDSSAGTHCRVSFSTSQVRTYADVADDHNPLHLDAEAARSAGHSGPIVHGMFTLARSYSAMVERLDPEGRHRLVDVHARFSRPVHPGDVLDVEARRTVRDGVFRAQVGCAGRAVLKSSWLEVAA
jgi:acyl dehydratase